MNSEDDAVELLAICEVCMQPIEDGDGAVWVQPPPPGSRRDTSDHESLLELLAADHNLAAWHVTHTSCSQAQAGYHIAVERIRTWAAYLHWTAHLMDKDWVANTNWSDMAKDSLDPTSTTPGGLRPSALRDLGHRNIGD